jgi:hypothetical protein
MSEEARADVTTEVTTADSGARKPAIPTAPLEPEDFYYENGLMVFTAAYHLKRGYCCNSGCRHCPFR